MNRKAQRNSDAEVSSTKMTCNNCHFDISHYHYS